MKQRYETIFRLSLIILDCFALVAAFTIAYILRIKLDPRPFYVHIGAIEFIVSVSLMIPLWILMFYLFQFYTRHVYTRPLREAGRIFLAAIFGVMFMISFGFFTDTDLFPTKLVAFYSIIASFTILLALRVIAKLVHSRLLLKGYGVKNVILTGNSPLTKSIAEHINENPQAGYKIMGIAARNEFIPEDLRKLRIASLKSGVSRLKVNAIMQTDNHDVDKNYEFASQHYLEFYQAPSFGGLLTARHSIDILGSSPIVKVSTTPLDGLSRITKRLMDIIGGSIGLIIASPIMLIVAIAVKLGDPKGPVFMRGKQQFRMTRYDRPFKVYKFRSHYAKFDGKTDEEVFRMVGRPELIEEYRANGDKLDVDFRVTPVGKFIRRFSLDELPQLINVVKGDISLVGPRALVAHEISMYKNKHFLLTVKSGLTGLAVVSGRRDISFEERRQLDLYYVQNWSLWLDIRIILKTFLVIFK